MPPRPRPASTPTPPVYLTSGALVSAALPLVPALEVAGEAGADGIELQADRIALALNPGELKRLPELLRAFPAPAVLRADQPLFRGGASERDLIYPALLQAHSFGCRLAVFPLGDVAAVGDDALEALRDTLARLGQDFPKLRIAAVNGEGAGGTDLARWGRFLQTAGSWPTPVGMSFDIGHWICSGADLAGAAHDLGGYVEYIRVAGATMQNGRCVARAIQPAAAALPALGELPPAAPRAVAFAVPAPDRALLAVRLREYIGIVRSGQFTLA